MLIVAERFDTFRHYFLMLVYPPAYFTLTKEELPNHKKVVRELGGALKAERAGIRNDGSCRADSRSAWQ